LIGIRSAPFVKCIGKNDFSRILISFNYPAVKLAGGLVLLIVYIMMNNIISTD
jgi:hypothetical protein